jgi:hypothetical protein
VALRQVVVPSRRVAVAAPVRGLRSAPVLVLAAVPVPVLAPAPVLALALALEPALVPVLALASMLAHGMGQALGLEQAPVVARVPVPERARRALGLPPAPLAALQVRWREPPRVAPPSPAPPPALAGPPAAQPLASARRYIPEAARRLQAPVVSRLLARKTAAEGGSPRLRPRFQEPGGAQSLARLAAARPCLTRPLTLCQACACVDKAGNQPEKLELVARRRRPPSARLQVIECNRRQSSDRGATNCPAPRAPFLNRLKTLSAKAIRS